MSAHEGLPIELRLMAVGLAPSQEERARLAVRRHLMGSALTLERAIRLERIYMDETFADLCKDNDFDSLISLAISAATKPENAPEIAPEVTLAYDEFLRRLCAQRIAQALPPSPWRDFAIIVLQRPAPPSKWFKQRNGILARNAAIMWAVRIATEQFGLSLTRRGRRHSRSDRHSACSLVAEELGRFRISMTEAAVEKIWANWTKEIRKIKRNFSDGASEN